MSALGSLVVKLALDYAQYTRGLSQSDQDALRFAQNVQRNFDRAGAASREFLSGMAKTAIGAVAAFASVNAVIEQMGRSIDSLAALDDLTQKTGSSVENLSRLQQVASAFGADLGAVDGALVKLSKGMAGVDDDTNKTHKALTALGVSAKDAAGKLRDPSEVLVDVAKQLQNYEDGAAKAALVNDLFGKSGADLLPYLNDVAESVDKFTGVSAEAATEAARYQDQLGLLKVRYENMSVAVTTAALPALNDLIGAFSDTLKAESDLDKGSATEWADDLAVGIARVIDVAKILPGIFSAVIGSFKVVSADAKFLATTVYNLTPAVAAAKIANGGSPLEDLKKALVERNQVVDDANRRYDELWNKPANLMEQAVLARIAARGNAAPANAASPAGDKSTLRYSSGAGKQEAGDYEALNKALQEKLALSRQALDTDRALTEAERQMAAITRGRAEGTINLTDKEAKLLESGLMQLSLNQQLLISRGESERLEKEALETNQKKIAAAFESVDAMQAEIDNYGKLPEEITRATIAKLEQRKASLEANGGLQTEIDTTEALIVANTRLAALQGKKAVLEKGAGVTEAKELLDIMSSLDEVAKSAAEGMAKSFGSVGSAIGGVTTVITGYSRAQAAVAAQLATSLKAAGTDQDKISKANKTAAEQSAQAQIRSYGDMASAGKAFFKEHTAGYTVMEGIEKSFRAVEMAMAIENTLEKSGLLTAFTGLFVSAKATETAVDTSTTATSVVNSGIRAAADGVAAFAKTLASLPFPFNVAAGAAVVALLAGVGVAIGGGGGGGSGADIAKERQARQGTGSVLGDANAKSDSISRSLDELEKNSDIELSHTAGMLLSLRSIESSISGLGNLLVRNSGLTGELAPGGKGAAENFVNSDLGTFLLGGSLGTAINKITGGLASAIGGKVAGAIFGGKVTTLDTGVTLDKTSLGNALSGGVAASQYTDTKKAGGLFHSDKYRTDLASLGAEANDQFTKVIRGLAGSVTEAGKLLGLGGESFTNHLNQFVIDIGKISLKDLSGEEIQQQLEAVFSKLGDDLAQFSVGGLQQFQQVGEGYFETLTRVAANYANLDAILAATGSTFGATGLASIAARENFIALAGGIDALAGKSRSFADQFMSEAERLAPVQKYVVEQLAAMGLAGIDTRDKYKEVVLGLAASGALATEAGAKQYAALLDLSDAFAQVYAATEDVTKSEQAIADQRKSLQERYNQLTMTSAQLRVLERAGIDASNLALYDSIVALELAAETSAALAESLASAAELLSSAASGAFDVLTRSINAEKKAREEAHKATLDALKVQTDNATQSISKLTSLSNSLHGVLDAMRVQPGQELAGRRDAQAQIAAALAKAKAGGPLPEAEALKGALSTLSKDSSSKFSSFLEYQRDAYRTANDLAALSALTDNQLSIEQRTLNVLERQKEAADRAYEDEIAALDDVLETAKAQLDYLNGINNGVAAIPAALASFAAAIAAATANPIAGAGAAITGAYREYLGRDPEAGAVDFWKGHAANGVDVVSHIKGSDEAKVRGLYKSLLGREGDAQGMDYWVRALGAGMSIDEVAQMFKSGAEYQALHPPGFALGGDHSGGYRIVGENGPELEATGPSRIFNARQTADLFGGGANAALVAEVRELRRSVERLQSVAAGIETNTGATATSSAATARTLTRVTQGSDHIVTKEVTA